MLSRNYVCDCMTIFQDLALAHSSYARVAGIQSEVNKVTVTRVAGSEVQYQKQMNLQRKDMEIMVRNIRKEQKKLRKSIVRYSRKLHEGRRDRAKRELEDQIRDKNSKNNMRRISEIYNMQFPQNSQTPPEENKLTISENLSCTNQEKEEDTKENVNDQQNKENVGERDEALEGDTEDGGLTLPPISAPAPSGRKSSVYAEEDNLVREPRTLPEITLNPELETRIGPKRTLRAKKQGVSYSDLIKLQHSTSSKKLFSLVNILAQKHGGKNRNIEQNDASRPTQLNSLPAEKFNHTGSISEVSTLKTDRHKLNFDSLESTTDGKIMHPTPKNHEKSKQSSARVKSPRSVYLPIIPRQPVEESLEFRKMTKKRGPISWTDAIALIKGVHTLID